VIGRLWLAAHGLGVLAIIVLAAHGATHQDCGVEVGELYGQGGDTPRVLRLD
jgi:hypothetical protein